MYIVFFVLFVLELNHVTADDDASTMMILSSEDAASSVSIETTSPRHQVRGRALDLIERIRGDITAVVQAPLKTAEAAAKATERVLNPMVNFRQGKCLLDEFIGRISDDLQNTKERTGIILPSDFFH